jgi:hypothetical protein
MSQLRRTLSVALVGVALSLCACQKVAPAAARGGTAELSWTPVTKDIKGKELTNLAGYKVLYGTSPRALYTVIVLSDPHSTRYVVRELAPGRWYFAVAAYTSSNVQGAQSNVASKTIR